MKALEGKIAVITGGSSGIGLATARLFQQAGARVAISGRNQQSLDDAARALGDVLTVRSDVSRLSDLDRLFEFVTKKLGRIDVLFANAGIAKFAPVTDVSEEAYDETFDINVKGVFFTMQKAIPFLNDNASVILNTSFVNQAGVPTTSVYAASKAAVRSLARSISAELAARGIRVNVVSPGPIATPLYENWVCPKRPWTHSPRTLCLKFLSGVLASPRRWHKRPYFWQAVPLRTLPASN